MLDMLGSCILRIQMILCYGGISKMSLPPRRVNPLLRRLREHMKKYRVKTSSTIRAVLLISVLALESFSSTAIFVFSITEEVRTLSGFFSFLKHELDFGVSCVILQ